jgi:hypothetical protein
MPKSIYFTDEAYQQITEAARLCGFRVSRGRGSQIALFVVAAANKACTGRLELVRVFDESEVEEVAVGEYQVKSAATNA